MIWLNVPTPRLVSASLAAGLTGAMLVAFLLPGPTPPRPQARDAGRTGALVFAQAIGEPAALRPPVAPRTGATPRAGDRLAARPPSDPQGPVSERVVAPSSPAPGPAQPAPPDGAAGSAPPGAAPAAAGPAPAEPAARAARAASAALQLDRHVVREASRASRSAVQRLAEASGHHAGDPPTGADARLAESVARTVKPDCFPAGGTAGLLSPIVSAWLIATDQCRNR